MDLKKLSEEVEVIISDGEDLSELYKSVVEMLPKIDELGNAVGVLNPGGFSAYDFELHQFIRAINSRLMRIVDRRTARLGQVRPL